MLATAAHEAPEEDAVAPVRAIIAGGYTAGHIHCALALADGLRAARPGSVVLLAGARGGPEVDAARAAGYPIATVWIGGLDRRRSPRGLLRNLLLPLQLAVSLRQAERILRDFRPDVVVGVGAFPSAPLVLAAQRAGVPTLLHEANAVPGVANKLLARRADVICVGVEDAARAFPPGRARVTGNPVRVAAGLAPAAARRRLGLAVDTPTLLVVGGSLGTPALNRWVLGQQRALAQAGLQVLWQSGRAHHAASAAALVERQAITLRPFLDDMEAAYAAADLVVAAGGALTIAELAHLGKAAVIVPAGHVSEGHQDANAAALEARGAAVVREPELERRLLPLVRELLGDGARRRALGARLHALAAPDATRRIVAEIVRIVRLRG